MSSANFDPRVSVANVTASAVSAGASFNTDPVSIGNMDGCLLVFVWSAGTSPVGVISVQGSDNGTDWFTLAVSDNTGSVVTSLPVSGASGVQAFDIGPTTFPLLRGQYVRTSGTATMAVRACAKAYGT